MVLMNTSGLIQILKSDFADTVKVDQIIAALTKLTDKYFSSFFYFYSYIRYRVFIAFILSLLVAVLDGFGLAMFLPLLQLAKAEQSNTGSLQMGSLKFLVDGLNRLGIPLNLNAVLLMLLLFFVLKGIARFLEGYFRVTFEQYFMRKIRLASIDVISSANYKEFIRQDAGRVQNTLSGEVEKINQAYQAYFSAFQYAVMILTYILLAFLTNAQFAVFVVAGGLVGTFVFKKIYVITKGISRQLTNDAHAFQRLLGQYITFFKYLKSTGLIYRYSDELKKNILQIEQSQKRMGILNAALIVVREPLIVLVVIIVVLIQIRVFSTDLGLIILNLLFFYRSLAFLMSLQNYWGVFISLSGSLENMSSFTKELKSARDEFGTKKYPGIRQALVVKNLTFLYDDKVILNDISFEIGKNETLAVIGESGSGKTTLMNILSGLISPLRGNVLVDATDIRVLDIRTYQQRIGYITQEPVIFNDTIFNNVTFWDKPTSENIQRFWKSLQKASINNFVASLPQKMDALLGNNGINLSGGQKQRISIARELYKDIDFLFMDEATSSLDAETERAIQENIEALKGKYTIIVIAHRLSTIRNADRILLLNNGKIEQTGTFDELMNDSSYFQKMVELQAIK